MTDLDKISARLGSLRGVYKNEPSGALRTILFEDMPRLLAEAKAARAWLVADDAFYASADGQYTPYLGAEEFEAAEKAREAYRRAREANG